MNEVLDWQFLVTLKTERNYELLNVTLTDLKSPYAYQCLKWLQSHTSMFLKLTNRYTKYNLVFLVSRQAMEHK